MKNLIEDLVVFSLISFILLSPFWILLMLFIVSYFWSLLTTVALCLLYGSWIYIDQNTNASRTRSSNYIRRLYIWSIVSNYFPVKLVKTEDLDGNRNYIFGYHPHGRLTAGAGVNFLTEATHFSTLFPGIRPHLMTLSSNFLVPFIREIFLLLGACGASRENCQYFLNGSSGTGNAVVIVIGGMREIYLSEYKTMIFYLKKRKGFIRLALENGASLVPVISFGENEHFRRNTSWISNRLPWGRSVLGYLPLRHEVMTIVGKPIHVNQNINPSQTDIDQLHLQYTEAVEKLYNMNKNKYGFEHVPLEII